MSTNDPRPQDDRPFVGVPLDAAPRRFVPNEAPPSTSPHAAAAADGALDARVGRVDHTGGKVYSPAGVVGAEEEFQQRDAARAPAIFLAAPGMVALLFAGMADKVGSGGGSGVPLMIVATVAALIGGACFWAIARRAESSEAKVLWLLGVVAAVGLWLRALMMVI